VGITFREFVGPIFEVEQFQQGGTSFAGLRGRHTVKASDKVQHLRSGELVVQEGAIRYEPANAFGALRFAGEVEAA